MTWRRSSPSSAHGMPGRPRHFRSFCSIAPYPGWMNSDFTGGPGYREHRVVLDGIRPRIVILSSLADVVERHSEIFGLTLQK
jgi:hypothetical protein